MSKPDKPKARPISVKVINQTFDRLIGTCCWGIENDVNLNLSISFGKPILRIREPFETQSKSPRLREWASSRIVRVKGEWWLWIFCAFWKISFDGKKAAGSSSSWRQQMIAIARLNGQILKSVIVNPQSGATRFEFDLGGVLEVRRFERNSTRDLWMLYQPDGWVLTVRGDGQYVCERQSEYPEKLKPRRIVGEIRNN